MPWSDAEVTMTRIAHTLRNGVWIGCLAAIALAATPRAQTKEAPAKPHSEMGMMADCQKMMADMKAGQEKLEDLIAKMNAASGEEKINEMAAVLTELVARQKSMHDHMTTTGHEPAR
jgi:hypothetical protein